MKRELERSTVRTKESRKGGVRGMEREIEGNQWD